jgi:CRISPR-associated endonuclease Csn1
MSKRVGFTLGLDLGTESTGWALLQNNDSHDPPPIVAAGVHRFDAGVEGDYASGKDKSRATQRREARQPRRQHWRRAWRRRKILRLLQRQHLLPPGCIDTPSDVHEYLLNIDRTLRSRESLAGDRVANHMLPYRLRRRALDEPLPPDVLGRALYHLAQRRGFLSNRKTRARDEDDGQVKQAIGVLRAEMQSADARTLGEYLAQLDPERERVRRRWTARDMFTEEFDAIWEAQRPHHPALLTDEFRAQLENAFFYQRPLKSQHHLLGKCELVPTEHRAPQALLIAQTFRLLQRVNDLAIVAPHQRDLSQEERDTLVRALERNGDHTFAKIRKLLGLPRNARFNLETDGEKRIPGNRTNVALAEIFGDAWPSLPYADRQQVVEDVLSFEKEAALARRAQRRWGLAPVAAQQLATLELEPDYARHGRTALARLVAGMADGTRYATARKREFPEQFQPKPPCDILPPVKEALPDVTSPAVLRALTELRKVVNAIVRRHGKPNLIRIELARDLKRSRKQRRQISNRNRQNERARARAAERILREMNIAQPSRTDIEKVLLAEECNWICPFTNRTIGMQSLLGRNPEFDIEHIWPFSRSLDNSFLNKTLCYHEENRARKRNSTPWEAYGHDPDRWDQIVERVRRFSGDAAASKLRRFTATEIPEDLAARELQETRFISRRAAEYLALLYGGTSDEDHHQRVQVSTGRVTAHLRNEWQLNGILGDGGAKSRDDHRHHAVDAITIALASPAVVHQLARAAENAASAGRRLFAPIQLPWPDFLDDVRRVVLGDPANPLSGILVSKRVSRRLNGPLHAETLYSKPIAGQVAEVRHVRKALHALSPTDLKRDTIVDPVVRKLVHQRYAELGGGKPDKVFADPASHPVIRTRTGREIPIHKVRVRARVKPWPVGKKARQRWVVATGGSNHHTAIVAILDKNGAERRWEDHPVTRFDVMTRRREGEAIVQRNWGPDRLFKFSLVQDDVVLLDLDGVSHPYRVQKISKNDIEFRLHCDARTVDEISKAGDRLRASGDKLRRFNARKIHITHLGEVHNASG